MNNKKSNFDKPLETAKDLSFVLLSNILIAFFVILIIVYFIYYITIKRKQHSNSEDFFHYFKNQFQFDNPSSNSSSNTSSNKTSNNFFSFKPPSFTFDNVLLNYFKYPFILFIISIIFIILFSLPKKHPFFQTSNISIPILVIFYLFILYKSYQTNYLNFNNFNLNRLKSVAIFFIVIFTLITFYIKDPGNFVSNNFGTSILIIIVIAILVFLQLINVLLVNKLNPFNNYKAKRAFEDTYNFQKMVNLFSYSLFFIYIFFLSFYFNSLSITLKFILPIIGGLWGGFNIYQFLKNPIRNEGSVQGTNISKYIGIFIGIIILLFTIILSIKLIDDFAGKTTTFGKIITILIIFILLSTFYKFIKAKYRTNDTKLDNIFNLFLDGLFFIPCLLNDIFDFIYRLFYYLFTDDDKFSFYNKNDKISMLIIFFIILFFLIYFILHKLNNQIITQNGIVLINQPVYLNKEHYLGNYKSLNNNPNFKYNFSISFWIFLHSNPSNNADKFYSILNYANKPNFLFNPSRKEFKVICDVSGSDGHNEEIIYSNSNLPLQKWNNIIFTSNNGFMDIFINNHLVISKTNIIPYVDVDALSLGENNGLNGGIGNVIYFKKPLTIGNIFILYNSNKYKNKPILDLSTSSILSSINI